MEAKKEDFLNYLRRSMGIITVACDNAGVSRATVRNWRLDDPEFAAAFDEITEMQLDFVESSLLTKIKEGDTAATIFYLKTKGKRRGYTEKPQPKEEEATPIGQPLLPEVQRNTRAKKKKVEAKKNYIIRLMKKQGRYSAELSMQVKLTAESIVELEELLEEMAAPDYQRVLVETSREGHRRESINPLERLRLDMSGTVQKNLRALGLNVDSKERKNEARVLDNLVSDLSADNARYSDDIPEAEETT